MNTGGDPKALLQTVVRIVTEEVGKRAPESAVVRTNDEAGRIVSVRVHPRNPGAASFDVMVEVGPRGEWGVTLVAGEGSTFELSATRRWELQEEQLEAELSAAVGAILDGNFEETLWIRGKKVASADGRLRVGEEVWRSPKSVSLLPRSWLGFQKRVVCYGRYVNDPRKLDVRP